VLVTGGAGFIGSNFVRHLLDNTDWNVFVIDKLTYAGNMENLKELSSDPRFGFYCEDIADRTAVTSLFERVRPTWVVNLAAETHVDRSIDDPWPFLHSNTVGTLNLLEAARGYWKRLSDSQKLMFRFLHVSTDEVFGTLGDTGEFKETTPYAPNSPYSASKASADHFVRAYWHTFGLPTLTTNCSNNYGPFQFPEKLIPLMLLNAIEARKLPVYGDGQNVRDWLHVSDHCEALQAVLISGNPGETYNIGGCSERTNLQVVHSLCSSLEELYPSRLNPKLKAAGIQKYSELVSFVKDRPGHDRRYAIDSSKIENDLGWRPSLDFEDGLRATIAWYLQRLDWCQSAQTQYRRERLGLGLQEEVRALE
jgi:dTDP-glucose 4,6-dehydratase